MQCDNLEKQPPIEQGDICKEFFSLLVKYGLQHSIEFRRGLTEQGTKNPT